MDSTYRGYLQGIASSDAGLTSKEANALLQVVGDDYGINEGFLNQQYDPVESRYSWNDMPMGVTYDTGAGQIESMGSWYGPDGISALNDQYSSQYKAIGGGGGTTTSPSYTTQQYNDYLDRKSNIDSSALDAAKTGGASLGLDIRRYLADYNKKQSGIDDMYVNNFMSQQQGSRDIRDMVGRGIRSGGTMLANKNAADSSASEALARAYAEIGNRNISKVNNQYELGNQAAGRAQTEFNTDADIGFDALNTDKQSMVTDIVGQARSKIETLKSYMSEVGITDQINIQAEIERIQQVALGELSKYEVTKGSPAMGMGDVRSTGSQRMQAGQGGPSQFDFQSQVPAQWQNTGPFAGNLPIFTGQGNKKKEV